MATVAIGTALGVGAMTTSWRDRASTQAREDLDGLLDAALEFATEQLRARGEFFPYAAAVGTDGNPAIIAARPDALDECPASVDVIDACRAALAGQRDYLRATAIIADVSLGGRRDAVRVELEHLEGHAVTVLLPYERTQQGGIVYGALTAGVGTRRLWP